MAVLRFLDRHRALAVIFLLWAATVLLAPSLPPVVSGSATASAPAPGQPLPTTLPQTVAGTMGTRSSTTAHSISTVSGGGSTTSTATSTGPLAPADYGVSRGGVTCRPGALQVSYTTYAPPCVPLFTGNNGGATANGVTATTIRIAERQVGSPLGSGADPADAKVAVAAFIRSFNKTYELYGRHVVIDYYTSPHGNSLTEASGGGRDAACEDAVTLAQQHHDFGVLYSSSQPFMQCAAEQHLVIFDAEGRPTETFLDALNPYIWGYEQGCYRVILQSVEYIGKRLAGRKAEYAGDPALAARTRKFGIMYPDNDTYQPCLALGLKVLKDSYGVVPVTYAYTADLTRIGDQAAQAALRFKSEGVTTLVLATDDVTMQVLTKSAASNGWRPEWLDIGTGGTDYDPNIRGCDRSEIDGHLFGRTDFPVESVGYGPGTEEYRVYRMITGKTLPTDAEGYYWTLIQVFRMLQSAGPDLTAPDIATGMFSLPEETGPSGTYSWRVAEDGQPGTDHEGLIDQISIWWEGTADGGKGMLVQADGGRRFRAGQWPTTEPENPE